jgi:hypothetical protein
VMMHRSMSGSDVSKDGSACIFRVRQSNSPNVVRITLKSCVLETKYLCRYVILMSIFVDSLGGLNEASLRKSLTYSAINDTGRLDCLILKTKDM